MNNNWLTLDGIGLNAWVCDMSTLNNPPHIVSEGYHGNALELKYGQYIDFGENNDRCLGNLDLCPNGFSVAMWIKLYGKSKQFFFSNAAYFEETAGMNAYIYPMMPNKASVTVNCFNRSLSYVLGQLYLNPFLWHHFAITCNLDTGVYLYIDGNFEMSDLQPSAANYRQYSRDANMTIGRSIASFGFDYHLEAIVDEVYMNEEELDMNCIKELYEL